MAAASVNRGNAAAVLREWADCCRSDIAKPIPLAGARWAEHPEKTVEIVPRIEEDDLIRPRKPLVELIDECPF